MIEEEAVDHLLLLGGFHMVLTEKTLVIQLQAQQHGLVEASHVFVFREEAKLNMVISLGRIRMQNGRLVLRCQIFYWKQIAEPVMKVYTETTDGSTIETKESGLVWNYQYADPDFGSCQAKELLDHLESDLANEPVTVKSRQNIVEVKPQGVNKGLVADRLLTKMKQRGMPPDFVLCIGDDMSDEDMFEVIARSIGLNAELLQWPLAIIDSHEDKVLCAEWWKGYNVVSGGADSKLQISFEVCISWP